MVFYVNGGKADSDGQDKHLPPPEGRSFLSFTGPLSLATDYMVWNVTKDKIRVRMSAIDEDIWPQPSVYGKKPPDLSQRIGFSKYIDGGRVNFKDVVDALYSEINKKYGTQVKPPY